MSEQSFDKNIREKLQNFSFPEEHGDWEGLTVRMSRRAMILRRRRVFLWSSATAACLLLLMFLLMPVLNRDTLAPETICRIVPRPVHITVTDYPRHIHGLYAQLQLDRLREASVVPATSELFVTPPQTPVPETEKVSPRPAAEQEPAAQKELAIDEPVKEKPRTPTPLFPVDLPEPSRMHRKWITAANFSYQGAINGNYIFTPSTYTTKWETPLSLAGSDLSNLGIPDYMAPNFDEDDVNLISAHFSTPISAGINVQKEFNKWLSVGASLTYTLLRGEYQVHTADKSYIVNQNTHYIGIPVSVYFRAVNTPRLTVYAVGGGALDKAVADEYICQLNDVATRQYVPVQGFQLSVYGGLGIEYKWSEWMGIYIEPTVSHYFENNQPKSIRTIQPTQFKMELGIRFRI
ncbi:MAG: hypothetical protein WC395_02010 [Bacteroidales bacterium]|jgi:hypothetical protein